MKQQPVLLFIRGLPGSGKSYLSDALIENLGQDRTVLADPDAIDVENEDYVALSDNLSEEGLSPAIHPFRWLRQKACEGISSGKIVVWNQPFTDRGVFDRLILFIKANSTYDGELKVLIVEVEIDHDTAKKRIEDRITEGGHGPSSATFQRRIQEYRSFSDGYATLSIRGDSATEKSLLAVVEALELA